MHGQWLRRECVGLCGDLLRVRIRVARRERLGIEPHGDRVGGITGVLGLANELDGQVVDRQDLAGLAGRGDDLIVRDENGRLLGVDVVRVGQLTHGCADPRLVDSVDDGDVLIREQGAEPAEGSEGEGAVASRVERRGLGGGLVHLQADGFGRGLEVAGRGLDDNDAAVVGRRRLADHHREIGLGQPADAVPADRHVAHRAPGMDCGVHGPGGDEQDDYPQDHPERDEARTIDLPGHGGHDGTRHGAD